MPRHEAFRCTSKYSAQDHPQLLASFSFCQHQNNGAQSGKTFQVKSAARTAHPLYFGFHQLKLYCLGLSRTHSQLPLRDWPTNCSAVLNPTQGSMDTASAPRMVPCLQKSSRTPNRTCRTQPNSSLPLNQISENNPGTLMKIPHSWKLLELSIFSHCLATISALPIVWLLFLLHQNSSNFCGVTKAGTGLARDPRRSKTPRKKKKKSEKSAKCSNTETV